MSLKAPNAVNEITNHASGDNEEDNSDSDVSSSSSEGSIQDANASVVLDLPPGHTADRHGHSRPTQSSDSLNSYSHPHEIHPRENFVPKSLLDAVQKRSFAALEEDGWSTKRSQSEFIGKCVRRYFPGFGLADGAVVAHLTAEENDGHAMWHIVHEDGDSEDISEDDYELCHEMFVKDNSTLAGLSRQKHPPGPAMSQSDGYSSASSSSSRSSTVSHSRSHRRRRNRRSHEHYNVDTGPTEHHRKATNEQRTSEYILQESYFEKEIRVGSEYQVDECNIPNAVPGGVTPAQESSQSSSQPERKNDPEQFETFLIWGKKQFLQPGMVTMAYVPTAKISLAPKIAPTSSSSEISSNTVVNLEPVLHHAQRYVAIVSYQESSIIGSDDGEDRVVVFDGISHHIVSTALCSIVCPPLVAPLPPGNADVTVPRDEMKVINLIDIWDTSNDPEAYVNDLCQDIRRRQLNQEGIEQFLKLWKSHKQSLGRYYPAMRRLRVDHKQVMGLYHLLLPYLCSTPVDRVCLQLRGVHRLVDILNQRSPYLPEGYANLPLNHRITTSEKEAAIEGSQPSITLLSREMDGGVAEDSDGEDIFVPQFVIPRKQSMMQSQPRRRAPPQPRAGGGGPRKVEKYDLSTGNVIALYDNQSKAALENEGVTQSQISVWCRGMFANTKNASVGYRFQDDSMQNNDDKNEDKTDKQSEGHTIEETDITEPNSVNATSEGSSVTNNLQSNQPHPTQYSYELDNGYFATDHWDSLYPTCSKSSHRGSLRNSRRGNLTSEEHPQERGHHKRRSSHTYSDSATKKSIARRAAAKYFGFSDRQEAALAAERELGAHASRRGKSGTSGHRKKAVEQFNIQTGETIKVFSSGSEAARALNLTANTVSCCCTGRMLSVDGHSYSFRFVHNGGRALAAKSKKSSAGSGGMHESRRKRRGSGAGGQGKAVVQFDIHTGETIGVFSSGMQASRELGLQQTSISQCCLGRRQNVGDFGFRFQNGDRNGSDSSSDSESGESQQGDSPRKTNSEAAERQGRVKRTICGVGGGGRGKMVEQRDLITGEHIGTYSSCKECSLHTGYNRNSISLCCTGRQRGIDNFSFRFVLEGDVFDNTKAVEQFKIDSGERVQEFASSAEAVLETGLAHESTVLRCCVGRQQRWGEFGFRFADPEERERIELLKDQGMKEQRLLEMNGRFRGKSVEQYDLLTGKTIRPFRTVAEAAMTLGVQRTIVSYCCTGAHGGIDGYSFRFLGNESTSDFYNAPEHAQPVEMFDLATDETLQGFPSTIDAADKLNLNSTAISLCCTGVSEGLGDISFRYQNIDERPVSQQNGTSDVTADTRSTENSNPEKVVKEEKALIGVEQFDRETCSTIKTFASSAAVANDLNVPRISVSLCCIGILEDVEGQGYRFASQGQRERVSRYIALWRKPPADTSLKSPKRGASESFIDDTINILPRKRRSTGGRGRRNRIYGSKEVIQYDLATGKLLKTYASGSKAAQALGISQSNVSHCCRGKSKSAGGFGFRFALSDSESNSDDELSSNSPVMNSKRQKNEEDSAEDNDESDDSAISPSGIISGGHVLLQQAQGFGGA